MENFEIMKLWFTENSPIMKALVETHKKHKKSGLKANDKQQKWKNPKGYEKRKQTWRERKKEKFESMEKVGLQRNLASHLGLRSQCQRKKKLTLKVSKSHKKLSSLFFGLLAPSGPKRERNYSTTKYCFPSTFN
jgi:hypothetical protein